MPVQRQLEEEARQKQFRARQYNPAMYAEMPPRARRSEPGARRVTTPKAPNFRTDLRLGLRQEAVDNYFTTAQEAAVARRQVALAREVRVLSGLACAALQAGRRSSL